MLKIKRRIIAYVMSVIIIFVMSCPIVFEIKNSLDTSYDDVIVMDETYSYFRTNKSKSILSTFLASILNVFHNDSPTDGSATERRMIKQIVLLELFLFALYVFVLIILKRFCYIWKIYKIQLSVLALFLGGNSPPSVL